MVQISFLNFAFYMAIANAHPDGHDKPQTIKTTSAVLQRRDSNMSWVISFADPKQPLGKKMLFIFLSHTGYYLSTNFTGD